jgi:hypothetical protein
MEFNGFERWFAKAQFGFEALVLFNGAGCYA